MITWNYIPGTKELQLYRSHYERHFSRNQLHIFDEAVKANQSTYNKIKEMNLEILESCINLYIN